MMALSTRPRTGFPAPAGSSTRSSNSSTRRTQCTLIRRRTSPPTSRLKCSSFCRGRVNAGQSPLTRKCDCRPHEMHALGRTPASPRTAGGSPQGGARAYTGSGATNRRPLAAGQSCCRRVAPAAVRPVGAAAPVAWSLLRQRGSSCCTAVNSGVRATADLVERLVEQERHTGAEAGREGRIRPASGKTCHRTDELGIDWTEPLPCRSTTVFHSGEAGACESQGRAERSPTRDSRRGRIPDFPVTRSHPPASWPSAANSSICRTYRKTAGEESRRRSPAANRWMRP